MVSMVTWNGDTTAENEADDFYNSPTRALSPDLALKARSFEHPTRLAMSSSAGRRRPEPEKPRRFEHALVIGHNGVEVVADRQRGRQVDGVERPQDARLKNPGGVEDPVIDRDEVHAS